MNAKDKIEARAALTSLAQQYPDLRGKIGRLVRELKFEQKSSVSYESRFRRMFLERQEKHLRSELDIGRYQPAPEHLLGVAWQNRRIVLRTPYGNKVGVVIASKLVEQNQYGKIYSLHYWCKKTKTDRYSFALQLEGQERTLLSKTRRSALTRLKKLWVENFNERFDRDI